MKSAEIIRDELIKASVMLSLDAMEAIESAEAAGGKAETVMKAIRENLRIASSMNMPMCQDTGAFWCLASIGRDAKLSIGDVERVVNEGAHMAAEDGYFRKSIVSDPVFERTNTETNLPVFISYEAVDGSDLTLRFLLKGFGSENCSSVRMLNPTAGEDGVVEAVIDMLKKAGGKPCPPVFLGIGIGGTLDRAALNAKKSFFVSTEDKRYEKLSERIKAEADNLMIGPGGLGGRPTALGVYILEEPTHIAGLPVALSVSCWAERKAEIVFKGGVIC